MLRSALSLVVFLTYVFLSLFLWCLCRESVLFPYARSVFSVFFFLIFEFFGMGGVFILEVTPILKTPLALLFGQQLESFG